MVRMFCIYDYLPFLSPSHVPFFFFLILISTQKSKKRDKMEKTENIHLFFHLLVHSTGISEVTMCARYCSRSKVYSAKKEDKVSKHFIGRTRE